MVWNSLMEIHCSCVEKPKEFVWMLSAVWIFWAVYSEVNLNMLLWLGSSKLITVNFLRITLKGTAQVSLLS